jgi:septum formation protein
MMTGRRIILASKSASRRALLSGARVRFEAVGAGVDEAAVKAQHEGDPASLAMRLAEDKALAVTAPGALVIGGDQVLEFEGQAYDKPRDMTEAKKRLLAMAGKTHFLPSGPVLA